MMSGGREGFGLKCDMKALPMSKRVYEALEERAEFNLESSDQSKVVLGRNAVNDGIEKTQKSVEEGKSCDNFSYAPIEWTATSYRGVMPKRKTYTVDFCHDSKAYKLIAFKESSSGPDVKLFSKDGHELAALYGDRVLVKETSARGKWDKTEWNHYEQGVFGVMSFAIHVLIGVENHECSAMLDCGRVNVSILEECPKI